MSGTYLANTGISGKGQLAAQLQNLRAAVARPILFDAVRETVEERLEHATRIAIEGVEVRTRLRLPLPYANCFKYIIQTDPEAPSSQAVHGLVMEHLEPVVIGDHAQLAQLRVWAEGQVERIQQTILPHLQEPPMPPGRMLPMDIVSQMNELCMNAYHSPPCSLTRLSHSAHNICLTILFTLFLTHTLHCTSQLMPNFSCPHLA